MSAGRIQYYDPITHLWKDLRRFAPLPYAGSYNSMVYARGKLYCAGGLMQHREFDPDMLFHDSDSDSEFDNSDHEDQYHYVSACQKEFYRYHARENIWTKLAPMRKARNSFHMVYMNGHIYAIGGSNENGMVMGDVERYSLVDTSWRVLASLPEIYQRISAIAFRGKIFVYGVKMVSGEANLTKHVLQVYHPDTNVWQATLSEQHEGRQSQLFIKPPTLFAYKDAFYRILYSLPQGKVSTWCLPGAECVPSVKRLRFDFADNVVTITHCEDVMQDRVPHNGAGAFRINEEVFVNEKGCVYNTGITVDPERTEDVNVSPWCTFSDASDQSNITCFTFDRKLLEH